MSWPRIKIVFEVLSSLFYATTMNRFSTGLWYVMKSGYYTTSLSGWTKKKPQSTSLTKPDSHLKRSRSLFGGLMPVWSTTAFWILVKTLHLRSTLGKSMKNWCLQPALVNRKGLILPHDNAWPRIAQPTLRKLNKLGYEVLPHLPYSPGLSPAHYHFFKRLDTFLQGKYFHNQPEAENAFQEFIQSWSTDFYATGI